MINCYVWISRTQLTDAEACRDRLTLFDRIAANLRGANLGGADLGGYERGPDGYARRKRITGKP